MFPYKALCHARLHPILTVRNIQILNSPIFIEIYRLAVYSNINYTIIQFQPNAKQFGTPSTIIRMIMLIIIVIIFNYCQLINELLMSTPFQVHFIWTRTLSPAWAEKQFLSMFLVASMVPQLRLLGNGADVSYYFSLCL